MGESDQEAEHRKIALERCPNNSKSLYVVGLLEHQSGQQESACEHWHKCLMFSNEFERPIIQLCRYEIGMKDFFEKVLPTDPYYRLKIAKRYFNSSEDLMLRQLLLNHTKSVLDPEEYAEAERNYIIGQLELDSQNYPVASMHFRKCLETEKDRVDWRIQYARSLIAETYYSKAIEQLEMCQKGNHQLQAKKLIDQAIRRSKRKPK